MTGSSYWFVNKPGDVVEADLPAYLAQGQWQCPDPAKYGADLESMAVGDRIALKIVTTRTTGLPFFNADRQVSVMTIFATGAVAAVDAHAGVVDVAWQAQAAPRDWYFWTYMWPVWRVEPGKRPFAQALVDFTFAGVPQPMDEFLSDPFWSGRFSAMPTFTWVPFYEEFASRLLGFSEDRSGLTDILRSVAAEEPLLNYVSHDKFDESTFAPMQDVDPFSVMATFNRGVTFENRRRIAELLGSALGVQAAVPDDFDGIPVVNNQNSWFMSYAYKRQPDDIDNLWRVFAAAQELSRKESSTQRTEFVKAYDTAKSVRGVKWNLSVGLYWARPNRYATLDSRSREFIDARYGFDEPTDGRSYLALCDELLDEFTSGTTSITSFPLLSYAAWNSGQTQAVPHSLEGFASWASRIGESIDLDAAENDYKREAAAAVALAADQAHAGQVEWTETFKKALGATNLVDFRFAMNLRAAMKDHPEQLLGALDTVWLDPKPERLDDLQSALGSVLGKVTPGNATALGALLLMSSDVESNTPYSPSRSTKWYELAQHSGPTNSGSATARYLTLLNFLDALAADIDLPGRPAPSRLEVQGMAWATTESAPPSSWSPEEQSALLAWRGDATEGTRAWLTRAKAGLIGSWLDEGYVSLAATHFGSVPPGATTQEVKEAVEAGYQHQDYSQRKALTQEYFAFLATMRPGDLVATVSDSLMHVGTIEGQADYTDTGGDRLRRSVAWQASVELNAVPASVAALLDRQGSIVDITEARQDLLAMMEGGTLLLPDGPAEEATVDVKPALPSANADLAARLHMPVEAVQEIIELLGARQQIVLYGPPGTGKTFIAKAIARYVVGADDPSRMQLVQFHPSYAYEDFFEGYRPTETESGQASFALQDGPLARMVREARQNLGRPYVLVIDEMNRANLAKVFGELYFLLEYRDESIQLQYRPSEAFRLPHNLFIIGTMNTADRSISLLDAAMRRRFSFVELHPDDEPVKGVLTSWLSSNGQSMDRAKLLAALNAEIEEQDRDLRIGPSYLMRPEADSDAGLHRVWKHDIMPLLEEHYYGRLTRNEIHARFGLDAIRAAATGMPPVVIEETDEPDELFEQAESASQ